MTVRCLPPAGCGLCVIFQSLPASGSHGKITRCPDLRIIMSSDPKSASDSFDVIVIGAGPAGYPAAIRAAQNKLTVACIDEWKNHDGTAAFGGTCLNAGCIPSKALLESTELYHRLREEFSVHGIKASGIELDLGQMQKRKSGV